MDIVLAGTGETVDLPIIIFGIALFFGIVFFLYWFPGWRHQKLIEGRETDFVRTLEEEYSSPDSGADEESSHDSH
jgi:hypothetical protein